MELSLPNPDPEAAIGVIRTLELTVTRRLAGQLHGDYRGLLPGVGMELADTRAYIPGDDVRRIDWAASARCGTTQLRTTVEDRELSVYVVIDISGSMEFGSVQTSKRYVGVALAAAFGFLAARGANRVGGGVFAGVSWLWAEPRSGRDAVRALLYSALTTSAEGEGDLSEALYRTLRAARRRGVVVVISDFLDSTNWVAPLAALSQTHDVIAVEVTDPRENELVGVGVVTFVDPESGEQRTVDTSSQTVRRNFAAAQRDRRAALADQLIGAGADLLVVAAGGGIPDPRGAGFDITPGDTWLDQLVAWLTLRRTRIAMTGSAR